MPKVLLVRDGKEWVVRGIPDHPGGESRIRFPSEFEARQWAREWGYQVLPDRRRTGRVVDLRL